MSNDYNQYFIKNDGTFVGDFEAMYQNCDDPWKQSVENARSPLKRLIAFRISHLADRRVIDLGCGSGEASEVFRVEADAEVLGLDVSPTAIEKARLRFPQCSFNVASGDDLGKFTSFGPTAICMCNLTWCILDIFQDVLSLIKKHFPGTMLFHTLTFYAPGEQKYGTEYFTNIDELIPYFSEMTIEETFTHKPFPDDGSYNSLLIAKV